jgi:hypothetical protein
MDQNPSPQESQGENNLTLNKAERAQYKIFIAIAAVVGLLLLIVLIIKAGSSDTVVTPQESAQPDYSEARRLSTSGEDPAALQDFLVDKIASGENDKETRSAIYWITHRYFDNGGNIYEIYDFIENHPEVSFLKDAEAIYPDVFAAVKARTVTSYSRESLLALLAYYEAIDAYGYANIAIWGLAANKYSEQAYMNLPNPSDTPDIASQRAKYFDAMLNYAQQFALLSENYLINQTLTSGSLADLRNDTNLDVNDLVVGLNQHASALANLAGLNAQIPSTFSFSEIFEYTSELTKTEVQRLYFFTNYLYATALVQSKTATPENVAAPLERIITYARENASEWRPGGSIERVVSSKNTREASVFSYEIAKQLAALYVPFKIWLVENGWDESDF